MLQPVTIILSGVEISIFHLIICFVWDFVIAAVYHVFYMLSHAWTNLPHNKFGKYMYLIDIVSDA